MGILGFTRKTDDKTELFPTDSKRSDSKSTLKEGYEATSSKIKTKAVQASKPGFWSLERCVFKKYPDTVPSKTAVETPPSVETPPPVYKSSASTTS